MDTAFLWPEICDFHQGIGIAGKEIEQVTDDGAEEKRNIAKVDDKIAKLEDKIATMEGEIAEAKLQLGTSDLTDTEQVVGPAFEPRSMAKQLKLFGTV